MKHVESRDTIAMNPIAKEGKKTMMDGDTVTAMKALRAQGHSATAIGKLSGCGGDTVLHHMRDDFAPPRRQSTQWILVPHAELLLKRCPQHDRI